MYIRFCWILIHEYEGGYCRDETIRKHRKPDLLFCYSKLMSQNRFPETWDQPCGPVSSRQLDYQKLCQKIWLGLRTQLHLRRYYTPRMNMLFMPNVSQMISLVIYLRWLLIHSGVCWHPRALLPSLLNMVSSAKCIVSMIVNFSMYRSIFIKTKCIRCKIIMRKENRTPCLYSLAFSFYFHHTSFRAFDMFLLFNSLIIWEEE